MFDEDVEALTELPDQIGEARAKITEDQIQMVTLPSFFQRLFTPERPETKTTNLFQRLLNIIGRAAQTQQFGPGPVDPFEPKM